MKFPVNFPLYEFIEDKDPNYPSQEAIVNLCLLANRLQAIRDIIGLPIIINSGYRSPEYNATIPNSAPNSYHTRGMAADIVVKGMPAEEVQELLRDWSGGLGKYLTFTHVDIRGYPVRWRG